MQEEENTNWNNGVASEGPPAHLRPGELGQHGICHRVIFKGAATLMLFPLRLVQETHKAASLTALCTEDRSVSIILQEVSLVLAGQVQGGHTHVARCGNELQAWYRDLLLLRHLFCTPYIC